MVGIVCIEGNLAVHCSDEGVPNNFAGKWVLWGVSFIMLIVFPVIAYLRNRGNRDK